MLCLLCNCAYGVDNQEPKTYGHSAGGTNDPNAPSDNMGSEDNARYDGLGYGCRWEAIMENGVPTSFYILCPSTNGFEVQWLIDPPPDSKTNKLP